MFSTDPISDMLTRIRNALSNGKQSVNVPFSSFKHSIAQQLVSNGFVKNVEIDGEDRSKVIVINLSDNSRPAKINRIERVSKPGRRLYAKSSDIPKVLSGRGMLIVSTPKGLMSDSEARKACLGGELICKVY